MQGKKFFLKKTLDFLSGLCYYNTREREGKPTKPERMNKMEYFEIMNTNLTELAEWLAYEEDMKSNPWG